VVVAALGLAGPAAAAPYPQNSAAPQLQGPTPPQDGVTYTVKPGKWTGPPGQSVQIARQWLRCNGAGAACQAIAGATGTAYTLAAADAGARVRVRETASCQLTTPICSPAASDSAPTAGVLQDPLNEGAPQVSGTAQVGQLLSASAGFWRSPAPLRFGYQWLRCDAAATACTQLPGATGPDFRPAAAEAGARLRVVVTAANSRPRSAEATSAPTGQVAAAAAKKKAKRKRGVRLLSPFPRIVIAGVIARGAAQLTEFTIRGPRGALVKLRCKGSCPFRSRRLRLRARRVSVRSLERRWRPGAVLEVTIGRPGFIGKFSRFRFRAGAVPKRQDQCLPPGARKPRRCPRGA
jgi:hypothetical protein